MLYDAIVVGLGPAGSTAAYGLSKRGLRVLAFDKARFPRYKSCGGCVSVKIDNVLPFDISPVIEDTVMGASFTYKSSRPMDIMSDRPVGYSVMRDSFDSLLLDKAREAGARIIEGKRIKGLSDEGPSVSVIDEDGVVHSARFLIGADGAGGFIGRDYFGLNPRESAISITAEVPYERALYPEIEGRLFIDFGGMPFGYSWIFPKKRVFSVGIAGDAVKIKGGIKEYFNSFVSSHPLLQGFDIGERTGWTVPLFYNGAVNAVKGRVLLAGDTGHLVDPFLGEGIYFAVKTAQTAACCVEEALRKGPSSLSTYEDWLKTELYPEFRASGKISDLVFNYPRLWYSILEKEPDIMLKFYEVVRGVDTNEAFHGYILDRVKKKPWKVLRRWIESRFLPSEGYSL